jgi:hypothetical protein
MAAASAATRWATTTGTMDGTGAGASTSPPSPPPPSGSKQQPTGQRIVRKPPAWMYKIPAGVREFIVMGPLFAFAVWLADIDAMGYIVPDYHKGPGREIYTGPPPGAFHLEPIYDPKRGKLVAYRHVSDAAPSPMTDKAAST